MSCRDTASFVAAITSECVSFTEELSIEVPLAVVAAASGNKHPGEPTVKE